MDITFIITTYNSSSTLENCLKSIFFQSPSHNKEIIVVDNFSNDRTEVISKKYTSSFFLKGPERSAQRNYGFSKASHNDVIYLDSDMILSPFFLDDLQLFLKNNNNPDALYINEKIIVSNFFNRIRDHERFFYSSTPIDSVRYIKKRLFNKVGGFDENLSGPEDWDLNNRVLKIFTPGLLISLIPHSKLDTLNPDIFMFYKNLMINLYDYSSSCIYHDERDINFIKHLSKKSYYSKDMNKYIDKWGRNNTFVKKQLGLRYRLFTVFFEKNKYIIFFKKFHLSIFIYFYKLFVYLRFKF